MNAVCTYNHIDFTDDVLLNRPETQPTQYGRDTTQISSWGVCAKLGKKMRVTWISDKSLLPIPRLQAETAWGPVPISPTWALAPQGGCHRVLHRFTMGHQWYIVVGCLLVKTERIGKVWIWVVRKDETYTFQTQAVVTMTNKINRLSIEVI